MKFRLFLFSALIGLSLKAFAGPEDRRVVMVYGMLAKFHYSPRQLDDSLSADIFDNFINSIDPDHLYFNQSDIAILSTYKFSIDDEIKSGDIAFLHKATEILKKRLESTDSLSSIILSKPLDYTENESFTPEIDNYPADKKALELRMEQYLKLQMLHRISAVYDSDSLNDHAKFIKEEDALRTKVLISEHRKLINVLDNPEGYPDYVCSEFCNAITAAFDPHSDYFPINEKENFMAAVTTESNSFGIEINANEKEEIYISQLIPGGAAWKSGKLHNGDVLLSLKWNKEVVDLNGAGIEEVSSILSSIGNQSVDFTIRSKSGLKSTVSLKKEKISSDENIVKSFVLKGDKISIGYITLPSFYSDDDSKEGSNCASDVGKELLKLSKEKIDGVILDLRYNGGGSLEEALELAGIFINEGALGFRCVKGEKPEVMRDPNRGTMYDGPLLLMVNGMTASASEIVAGGLQDYNRAVIVGSKTYGKATAQVVLPVDTGLNLENVMTKMKEKPEYGYVKVTIEKLYRATGKTNQRLGTTPDIELPDIYSMLKFREENNKNALMPDTIKRAAYYHPYNPLPVSILRGKSEARTASNENFNKIPSAAKNMAELENYDHTAIPLQIDAYLKVEKELNAQVEEAEHVRKDSGQTVFKVKTLSADNSLLQNDEIKNQDYNYILNEISTDIYIAESFRILNDLVNIQK